jgi:hypothetical protein
VATVMLLVEGGTGSERGVRLRRRSHQLGATVIGRVHQHTAPFRTPEAAVCEQG